MTKYVAFLRAINVGGARVIKMDDLRTMFDSFGLRNVQTFIQSGNVIFEAKAASALEAKIEKQLEKALGYRVECFLRTIDELATLVKVSPFEAQREETLHVVFLRENPGTAQADLLKKYESAADAFVIVGREVYNLRRDRENSVFSNNFIEKIFGPATTRKMTTLKKILEKYRP